MGLTNGLTKANIWCPEPQYSWEYIAALHFAIQNTSVFTLQRPDFAYLNVPANLTELTASMKLLMCTHVK